MKFYAKPASLMTLVSVLAVLVSCSEKVNSDDTTVYNGTFKISVTASKSGNTGSFTNPWTKALVSTTTEGKETVTAEWKAGDIVNVYQTAINQNEVQEHGASMWKVGSLTAQSDGVQTTLAGTITGTFTPRTSLMLAYQHADDLVYDFTGQDGTLKTIADKYDYASNSLYIDYIDGDNMSVHINGSFNSFQAIAKFVLTAPDGTALKPSKLTLSTSGESDFIQKFMPLSINPAASGSSGNPYLSVLTVGPIEVFPSGNTNEIYVALSGNGSGSSIMTGMAATTLTVEAVVGNDIYSYTKDKFTFNVNSFYVFNVTMTPPLVFSSDPSFTGFGPEENQTNG